MRSLFLKIFLSFWLASALIVGALILPAIWTPLPGQVEARAHAMAATVLTRYGREAVDVLERDGRAAADDYVERLEHAIDMHVFLFDESGEEALGRRAPAGARDLAARSDKSGKTEIMHSGTKPLAAQPVTGLTQRRYVVVGNMPAGPMREILSDPRLWAPPMVIVLLVACIVSYGLARYLTSPVRRLRDATRRLASGNFAIRVGATVGKRHDEIGDLGRDFDFMAERIESLISSQRQLLQDISHELRSPLARLNVALGLAGQRAGPEVMGALDRIEREAERLNELIGQLLTVTRLESGTEGIESVRIDLSELVQEIAADGDFEASIGKRRVHLVDFEDCAVFGSPLLLRSAIENVVRNAVRYTAEQTAVEITLRHRSDDVDSCAVIRVRDHGPGVPEAALTEIFRPFCRSSDARDRKTGGAGLGLAITERAVLLHGGGVRAANAPDGGLVVEIRLPCFGDESDPPNGSGGERGTGN
ncbi:MAG: ATP-binding protein [Planctomycetota bacterium]